MAKKEIDYTAYLPQVLRAASREGLVLVSQGRGRKPNAMTIGWVQAGPVWGRAVMMVMVRPSRYTFELLEQNGDFTVNVMPRALSNVAARCGSVSGREVDKFADLGVTAIPGRKVECPIIGEGVIHYECRTLARMDLPEDRLDNEVKKHCYPTGDLHRLYFGEILAAYADEDAQTRLG